MQSQIKVFRKLVNMANGEPVTVSRTLSSRYSEYWFLNLGEICVMGYSPEECFDKLKIEMGEPE
jgi:hypothetical protein